jgi:hypothetical protein
MRSRRLISVCTLLVAALVSLAAPAQAGTTPATAGGNDPASLTATGPESTTAYGIFDAPMGLTTNSLAVTSAVAAYNPGGCTTYADNPHPSAHVPGTINAIVRQSCSSTVLNNSTEAKLWESRWWGYNVIGGPSYSALKTSKTSSVSVSAGCRSNSIRVTGFGHYSWAGQHIRSAEVFNTKNVSC